MSRCNMGWVAFFLTRATGERDGAAYGRAARGAAGPGAQKHAAVALVA